MVGKIKKIFAILLLIIGIIFFYYPFWISSKLPIPADTIVGLYHPFRDFYAGNYPNGIPFKNFLITDPVRQTYIWKELAVDAMSHGHLPLWNPYEMSGKPLFANFQSGAFYPLNLLFALKPFYLSWSLFIVTQSLLAGIFSFIYLKNVKLKASSAILGSLAFTFSGFSISWIEWGTIVSTALWLPLVLYSIDRLFVIKQKSNTKRYFVLLCLALINSLFAGHLQIFSYLYVVVIAYFLLRWGEHKRDKKVFFYFIITNIFFVIITLIQWYPSLQFILLSSRGYDQSYLTNEGWFIPWKHLIQFVAPDFFGNPATINYYGTWNYQELVGYIGIVPLIFAAYSFYRKNSTVIFFAVILFVGLLLCLPTGISSIPYILKIPFISSAQPTRLLFLICFSLSILSAFGLEYFYGLKRLNFKTLIPLMLTGIAIIFLWVVIFSKTTLLFPNVTDMLVAKRNLIIPTLVFIVSTGLIILLPVLKNIMLRKIIVIILLVVIFADLFRFGHKFLSFSNSSYLYPNTKVINFLKTRPGVFRVAVMDRRIMPPNFFTHYKIQTIEGYDPLYLNSYAEFIASLERNKPDITPPFGFNRIITPHNYNSPLFDFLNTKYVLSYDDISSPKLIKVFEEGHTKVYENKSAYPRAFFVDSVISNDSMSSIFQNNLDDAAIITEKGHDRKNLSKGNIGNISYRDNSVNIAVSNANDGFLVLSDTYYPTWKAFIDGKQTKIYLTDHAFRGVYVPKGKHVILFEDNLF